VTEVVYGRRPVFEALRGRREVGRVWCTRRSREALEWLPERAAVEAPERLAARAASEEHQGVVAEVAPYPYAGVGEVMAGERPLVVALDEVTDPHNLGAVARVAECAGAGGLVITRRRSAAVTAAVCRASAGAVEHLRIARVENLAEFLLEARRPGLWSYAASAGAGVAYDAADYGDGAVFVLGAEGRGLRPRVRSSCDQEVSIPLGGLVDSLNVSTAAAVLLFEARRQRGDG
jgi:23S rRNA (guanosine2251-2'-O)-methyltransferase